MIRGLVSATYEANRLGRARTRVARAPDEAGVTCADRFGHPFDPGRRAPASTGATGVCVTGSG
jgi:hypothetical protein